MISPEIWNESTKMRDFTYVVPLSNYRKQFHYKNYRKQLLGLWEKHSPTHSNTHLIEFSIHLSIIFTRLALKNTTKYTYNPQASPHTNWSLFFLRWHDVPRVTKDGSQFPHSHVFNHPINSSSFLELPSFSKKVMLRSVRKAFWEDWLGFLGLFQSIQDELACINEALNAVHKTGLSPTVQLWPRLVHALLPTKFGHLVHQLLEALLLSLHLDEMLQLRVHSAQTRRGGGRRGIHPSATARAETSSAPTHRPSRVSATEPEPQPAASATDYDQL